MTHYVLIEDGGGQLHQIETSDSTHHTAVAYIYYGAPAQNDHSGLDGLLDAGGFDLCDLGATEAQEMLDATDHSDGGYRTVAVADGDEITLYTDRMGAAAKSYLGIHE